VPVRGGAEAFAIVKTERDALGVWRSAELRMAAVFATVALLWIFRPMVAEATGLKGLTDAGIAIAGAVAMFLVPAGRSAPGEALLTWPQAERLPWGVLLLFGGGLSLAAAMAATGVDQAIGGVLEPLAQAPDWVVILAIVALVIFLTELTSNVATITALLPVIGVIGAAAGIPAAALAVPAAAAASCAFMLPVATAPNAIAFGTRAVSVAQMATNGFWLNLCGIAIIAGLAATLGRSFYG
jgi:sodium-dependent dicarboxylate transporter 2/3/5